MAPHPASQFSVLSRFTGASFAMSSMFSAQLGTVLAVPLMVVHDPLGIFALFFGFTALTSLVLFRPKLRGLSLRHWYSAGALGLAMAVMLLCYAEAVTRIPVGPTVTIDFLGPLGVAALSLTGWPRVVLPALAACGVVAMSLSPHGLVLAPVGVLYALGAAAGWACYIVLMRHVGALFSAQEGLCLSVLMAAIFALLVAFSLEPMRPLWPHIPTIFGLSLLIPFALELAALRKMEMGIFSILTSLEPAIGSLLGFICLNQMLSLQQLGGIFTVILASACAVLMAPKAACTPL